MHWGNLNWLDLAIALVLLVSALVALFSGFLRELISAGALSLAFVLAGLYCDPAAALAAQWLGTAPIITLGAFLIIMILAWTAVGGLGLFLVHFLPKGSGGVGSRLLAFLLGIAKGLALVTVVLMVLTVYLPPGHAAFAGSRAYPVVIQGSRLFWRLLPDEERKTMMLRLEEIKPPASEPTEGFV